LSEFEQILVKVNEEYVFKITPNVNIGDIVISYKDGALTETRVLSIDKLNSKSKSVLIYREPYGLIVAGDTLAYNGCPIHMLTN